jgi:hypothetical protein
MTEQELARDFLSVPRAGLDAGLTSTQVYRRLQLGELTGLCVGARWLVSRASLDAWKAARAREKQAEHSAASAA